MSYYNNEELISLENKVTQLAKENEELREHLSNLVNESVRLAQFKNDTLRSKICSTDLDEPEWHDYQTIGEAGAYLEGSRQPFNSDEKSSSWCIDIFNDFSESEIKSMSPSIIGAWSRGKELLRK